MDVTDTKYSVADDVIVGYGSQLLVGNGASPETFQAVKGVTEIEPGDMNTEDIDVTHLNSEDRHREHVAGIRDSGPFTVTGVWLPEDESQSNAGGGAGSFINGGLAAMAADGLNRNFQLKLRNSSPHLLWPFRGYVASFKPGTIMVGDKVGFTATIQPVGSYSADLP